MDLSEFINVGRLIKPHGLKGQLKLVLDHFLKDTEDIPLQNLFIGDEHKPLPYFIMEIEHNNGNHFTVQFEGINDRNAAMQLSGKDVFVPENQFDDYFEEDLSTRSHYEFLIGFMLEDEQIGEIGKIEDVLILNTQDVAQLQYEGVEVLIPMVEEYIVEIDEDKQKVIVSLPEGLLEVYTGE